MFCTTPLTRNFGGECGSVCTCRRSASSRSLEHQICPKPRKKRCSGVKPSIFGVRLAGEVSISAISAMRAPPLSAVFSPSVSLPLMCTPGATVKLEYSSATQAARCSNSLASVGGPPVVQVAFGVELAALVVEAVRQLVPDHHADAAVVHGVVHLVVEERRLQDAGRES